MIILNNSIHSFTFQGVENRLNNSISYTAVESVYSTWYNEKTRRGPATQNPYHDDTYNGNEIEMKMDVWMNWW